MLNNSLTPGDRCPACDTMITHIHDEDEEIYLIPCHCHVPWDGEVPLKAQQNPESWVPGKMREQQKEYRDEMIRKARLEYQTTECEIEDGAPLSQATTGCWVGAWVWLPQEPEEVPEGSQDEPDKTAPIPVSGTPVTGKILLSQLQHLATNQPERLNQLLFVESPDPAGEPFHFLPGCGLLLATAEDKAKHDIEAGELILR